jgi:hypothetical protein
VTVAHSMPWRASGSRVLRAFSVAWAIAWRRSSLLAYGNRYACPAHAEHCYRAVKEQYERSGPARHCAFPYKKLTVLIGERSLYAKDGTPRPQRKPHLSPIWGGIGMQADEIMMVGPGQRVHARTDELCRWGAIRLPASDFVADEPVEFNVALLIKIEVPQHVDGDHMPGWAAPPSMLMVTMLLGSMRRPSFALDDTSPCDPAEACRTFGAWSCCQISWASLVVTLPVMRQKEKSR